GPLTGDATSRHPAGTRYSFPTRRTADLATTTGDITQPSTVTASSSNTAILCHGGDSTVTVSAGGGTGPYTGDGTFSHAAGTYSYTVTDHNGCTATDRKSVVQARRVAPGSAHLTS